MKVGSRRFRLLDGVIEVSEPDIGRAVVKLGEWRVTCSFTSRAAYRALEAFLLAGASLPISARAGETHRGAWTGYGIVSSVTFHGVGLPYYSAEIVGVGALRVRRGNRAAVPENHAGDAMNEGEGETA